MNLDHCAEPFVRKRDEIFSPIGLPTFGYFVPDQECQPMHTVPQGPAGFLLQSLKTGSG